ncbi:MAG TPA: hypothetical protein VGK48_24720 [Terriglobia bacterium]|jgi:serine/threonine-protein kinase
MRLEILRELGSGATGVVYLAHDRFTGATVALKRLRPDVAFPEQEVRIAQKITHRNVRRVNDFHIEDGVSQISMGHVEGQNLRALVG